MTQFTDDNDGMFQYKYCPIGHGLNFVPDNCAFCAEWLRRQTLDLDKKLTDLIHEMQVEKENNLLVIEIFDLSDENKLDKLAISLAKKIIKSDKDNTMFPFDIRIFDRNASELSDLDFIGRVSIHMDRLRQLGYGNE